MDLTEQLRKETESAEFFYRGNEKPTSPATTKTRSQDGAFVGLIPENDRTAIASLR